ncbi:MAG: sulfatase [Planctomyces sp.]
MTGLLNRLAGVLVVWVWGLSLVQAGTDIPEDARPNVLIILCDDLGYGDLGCNGHPIVRTEHVDRLAAGGLRLTGFYSAAPVCSPSRVGLLTGRSPNRAGIYDWIPAAGPQQPPRADAREQVHLRPSEQTLPGLLRAAGYATCLAGKWHCNSRFNSSAQPQPDAAGFDHWFATQNNAGPSHHNPVNYVRNGQPLGELPGYSCQLVADEISSWLRQRQQTGQTAPFFAMAAFHEPHEPIQAPPELVELYRSRSRSDDEAQYYACVHNLDLAVGRLVGVLEELQLRQNTLIVFTSDNGPETLNRYKGGQRSWGRTGILRGMKLHTHDGGLHVAGIMNWPAGIQPGRTESTAVSALDLLPTVLELAGVQPPEGRALDGISLAGFMRQGQIPARARPLLWAYYNAINECRVAMRHGRWKVLARLNSGNLPRLENLTPQTADMVRSAELTDIQIYDLQSDPGETRNLAGRGVPEETDLVRMLQAEYRSLAEDSAVWIPAPTADQPK